MLRVEYINPFIDATTNAFNTMVGMPVTPGKPWFRTREKPDGLPCEVCAVIGIGGKIRGSVILGFKAADARRVVARFAGLGGSGEGMSLAEVSDGVGELVNMIAGAAKAALFKHVGSVLSISIPNVIAAERDLKSRPAVFPALVVPFTFDGGEFFVEVSFENAK